MHQQYLIWRCGQDMKFRVAGKVYTIDWTMARERELQRLLAQWLEEVPDADQ